MTSELPAQLSRVFAAAKRAGAVHEICDTFDFVFRKYLQPAMDVQRAQMAVASGVDPFQYGPHNSIDLMSEEERLLIVCSLSSSHYIRLNKYPSYAEHSLILTESPLSQYEPLELPDFHWMVRCLQCVDSLIYSNVGPESGASQPHRHMQLIPVASLVDTAGQVPLDALVLPERTAVHPPYALFRLEDFRFLHRVAFHDIAAEDSRAPEVLAGVLLDLYLRMLSACCAQGGGSHSVLLTRDYFMVVPRSRKFFVAGFPVNSLGFAGFFQLLSTSASLMNEFLRDKTPLDVLASVGYPSDTPLTSSA